MYKNTVDLAQRRSRQLWLSDLMGAAEFQKLPPEEQRKNLVLIVQRLDAELSITTSKDERRKLGERKLYVQEAISAIRKKFKGPQTVPQFFIEVCRERLPPGQFKILMNEASVRAIKKQEVQAA